MQSFPKAHPPLSQASVNTPPPTFRDPASHSYPGLHFIDHIHLDLQIDHTARLLNCIVTYTIRILDPHATHLTLDTCGITISSVTTPSSPNSLSFSIEKQDSPIGAALSIELPPSPSSPFTLVIQYTTPGDGDGHPAGGALHWLEASPATADAPFTFTQSQAIHARSLIPCQDTPAVKMTYSACISVLPPHEHLSVVMSAQRIENHDTDKKGLARFECGVPVPSYLIAFASGVLEWRSISHRCCVWALPHVVEKARWEFEEVESMLKVAERVAGEYVWGRYDLLVLPPSFPYGGMENPFLTFVTPTLLSGDRSLVSVVVHEIAHSWTGNLVSCQDCRHFWVNEGFTVKLERRILKELYGSGREGLEATTGRQTLAAFVSKVGADHKYTSLVSMLQDEEDPDDYFSCVAYEKGYNFLLWLEHCVSEADAGDFHGKLTGLYRSKHMQAFQISEYIFGADTVFDTVIDLHFSREEFLREYIERNKYQSITSVDFVEMFRDKYPFVAAEIDFKEWLYGVGRCPNLAPLDTSLVDKASSLAKEWVTLLKNVQDMSNSKAQEEIGTKFRHHSLVFEGWDPSQKQCFLTELRSRIDAELAAGNKSLWTERAATWIQTLYDFDSMRNSEIRFVWCRLGLLANYSKVLANVEDFLSTQGRMKFTRPLFNDLHHVYPRGSYAKELFSKTRNSYHSIATKMIERDLAAEQK